METFNKAADRRLEPAAIAPSARARRVAAGLAEDGRRAVLDAFFAGTLDGTLAAGFAAPFRKPDAWGARGVAAVRPGPVDAAATRALVVLRAG